MTTSTLIGYKAASDLASKLSFFAIVVIAARLLTQEAFGLFSLAVTLGWILSVAADFGLQLHVAREVARRPGDARAILSPLARIRLGLTGIAAAAAIPLSTAVGGRAALAFFAIVAAQLLSSLVEFLNHLYRGLSRSDVESSLNLAQRLATLVMAICLLAWRPSLDALAVALVVPAAATLALSARISRRLSGPGRSTSPQGAESERGAARGDGAPASDALGGVQGTPPQREEALVRNVVPIGTGILLSALYFRIDLFLVQWWVGVDAVAVYNAAFRLVEALRLFPAAVLAVVFPLLCRTRSLKPVGFVAAGLLAFGLGLGGITWALAPWIVRGFYGETYAAAVPALRVLALAVPFFFLNYALTHQLVGWDAQARYARVSAAALAANLLMNAALLPRLGVTGAAWSTVLTELVVTAGCLLGLVHARPRRQAARATAAPRREDPAMLTDPAARLTPLEQAVLRTVIYASLFDYPLTPAQVSDTLIGASGTEEAILGCYRSSALLQSAIECRHGYFFLRGATETIARRRVREKASRDLLSAHRGVLRLICALPYTRLVALSGSAAHFNVDPGGDLDLFIVTRGSRVWSVTLAIVVLTKLLGCRRVVCANYVIADGAMTVERADLFSANQILHLRPLAGEALLREFVAANPFVAEYYPGRRAPGDALDGYAPGRVLASIKRAVEYALAWGPDRVIEAASRAAYSRYLRSRAGRWKSPDQVDLSGDQLKLHTMSHRRTILDRFEARVGQMIRLSSQAPRSAASR